MNGTSWRRSSGICTCWARTPYGVSGVPDIICCYKGRFLGLEAKLPGSRLTPLQRRALEKINRAGGIARRVESVEDVKAVIERADREAREGVHHVVS